MEDLTKFGEVLKGDVLTKRMVERARSIEQARLARDECRQELAFSSLPFILCGMPVKRPPVEVTEHVRHNGNYFLKILCDSKVGLPFGQDRLLPIWVATMAVQQKARILTFTCPAEMMALFGLPPDGPHYQRVLESFRRVFHAHIVFGTDQALVNASKIGLWLDSYRYFDSVHMYAAEERKDFDDMKLPGRIILSELFWDELKKHPIPLDLVTVRALSGSPAQLDFHCWLVWRCYKEHGECIVPLHGRDGLMAQLGVSGNTIDREFRRVVRNYLAVSKSFWPDCPANLTKDGRGLVISHGQAISERQLSLL